MIAVDTSSFIAYLEGRQVKTSISTRLKAKRVVLLPLF